MIAYAPNTRTDVPVASPSMPSVIFPTVPDGCLLTVSATQFPALDAEGQAMVRAMIDGLRTMLEQALLGAGADEQEAAELALCPLATNKSLAVLSRAGFSSDDLATLPPAAARIPGRPHPLP